MASVRSGCRYGLAVAVVILLALGAEPADALSRKQAQHPHRSGSSSLNATAGPKAKRPPHSHALVPVAAFEEDEDMAVPAVLSEFFSGGYPKQADWVCLEQLDTRTDGKETVQKLLDVVAQEIENKKTIPAGVDGKTQWDVYRECLITPRAERMKEIETNECFEDDGNGGLEPLYGEYLTTIMVKALDPTNDFTTFVKLRTTLSKVMHTHYAEGRFGEETQAFVETFKRRMAEADEHRPKVGTAAGMPRLSTDDTTERLKALCETCIQGTLEKLKGLGGEGAGGVEEKEVAMQGLAQDLEKWSHTLNCAMSSAFPECLPHSVYELYASKVDLEKAFEEDGGESTVCVLAESTPCPEPDEYVPERVLEAVMEITKGLAPAVRPSTKKERSKYVWTKLEHLGPPCGRTGTAEQKLDELFEYVMTRHAYRTSLGDPDSSLGKRFNHHIVPIYEAMEREVPEGEDEDIDLVSTPGERERLKQYVWDFTETVPLG